MSDTEQTPNTETPKPVTDNPQPTTPSDKQGDSGQTTFTQADLDRIIADRLKRDRESQQAKWLESLGVTSLDDAKTALEAKRKSDEAAMSELEKYQVQLDKANKRAEEAERLRIDLENRILADSRKQTFVSAIRDNGGSNPERVYALLQVEKPDDYKSIFGEGATPDDNKLKALIKQVQADYPEYFGTQGAGSPSNAQGIAPNSQNTEDLERQMKKKFGKL